MTVLIPSTQTGTQPTSAKSDARQLVNFYFYRVDPEWRRLPGAVKQQHGEELSRVIEEFRRRLMVLTYSLIGMKADTDFLVWCVGQSLEELQHLPRAMHQTAMAGYLSTSYAYLSMTKRSTYVDKLDPDHQDRRRFITPANGKYLFVYPFVKTREWYQLPFEQRQAMMDDHIRVGNKYPSVRLHTTYSFGLDDQEFVVAFETDQPQDFLDLVMELRETKGSLYTLRDTPIFTCIAKPFLDILKDLGA
jgi:chlorite dismutase